MTGASNATSSLIWVCMKARVALGDDAWRTGSPSKREAEPDRGEAVEPEPALGRVAARDARAGRSASVRGANLVGARMPCHRSSFILLPVFAHDAERDDVEARA